MVLSEVLDGNDLLYTERIQMKNKAIGYSYSRTIINSTEI